MFLFYIFHISANNTGYSQGEGVKSDHMENCVKKLKDFNAKRKLKVWPFVTTNSYSVIPCPLLSGWCLRCHRSTGFRGWWELLLEEAV